MLGELEGVLQEVLEDLADPQAVGDQGRRHRGRHLRREGQALVPPASDDGHQDQMCRTGDRQKLGQALDDRQDKDLNLTHLPSSFSFCSQLSELRAIYSRSS